MASCCLVECSLVGGGVLTSSCRLIPTLLRRPAARVQCATALPGSQRRRVSILQTRTIVDNHLLQASRSDDAQPEERRADAFLEGVLQFLQKNLLPLALVTGVSMGLMYPHPGRIAQQWGVSRISTSGIFLLSGLTLKTGDMLQAASAWPAMLFGMVSILFITPLAAIPILRLPLTPTELATGLAIFCCVPTTISSGVSLTQLVGANSALALALTVSTNLLGIITLPFMLSTLVGRNVGISLPAGPLLKALVQTLLIPLVIGKLFREFSGFMSFFDANKRNISMFSNFLLALVPWMQASCAKDMMLQVKPLQLLAAITSGIVLHATYLAWNSGVMWLLPAYWNDKGGDQVSAARAVILVASQKTLPVIVAVVANLNGALGEAGLLVLPCLATHLSQVLFDSVLVSYWLGTDKSNNIKLA